MRITAPTHARARMNGAARRTLIAAAAIFTASAGGLALGQVPAHAASPTSCDYGNFSVDLGGGHHIPAFAVCETTGQPNVSQRSGPSTNFPIQQTDGFGTSVFVLCQQNTNNTSPTGNPFWDNVVVRGQVRIGWVNDRYLSTVDFHAGPGKRAGDPNIPPC